MYTRHKQFFPLNYVTFSCTLSVQNIMTAFELPCSRIEILLQILCIKATSIFMSLPLISSTLKFYKRRLLFFLSTRPNPGYIAILST
jgi:hypothetical protein